MVESIVIKGISQGVLATLSTDPAWDDLVAELRQHIEQRAGFFRGAQIVVDVGARSLTAAEISTLQTTLEDLEVRLAGILSDDDDTDAAAQTLELETDLANIDPPTLPARPDDADEEIDSEEYGTAGVLIRRTLRNGRTVRSAGHVVVIGDVNHGAEVVAFGDIIVWGKVRGTVHAGAQGDEEAVVCALDLAPTQLRIANLISISPQDNKRRRNKKAVPEMAQISNGQIEAIPWNT